MKKITLKDLGVTDNTVISCPTMELAEHVLKIFHDMGLSWAGGRSYLDASNWRSHGSATCYNPSGGHFGSAGFYDQERDIITAGIFIERYHAAIKAQKPEIIGYKLVKPQYRQAFYGIAERHVPEMNSQGVLFEKESYLYLLMQDAGVLDKWFAPVVKEEVLTLPFGNITCVIDHTNGVVKVRRCDGYTDELVAFDEIKSLYGGLACYELANRRVHFPIIKIGEVEGTWEELTAIYYMICRR